MINLDLNNYTFRPGEQLAGNVTWHLEKEPKRMEIRLFWYTRGKGTEDALILDVKKIDPVVMQGSQEFNFLLPKHPYSFSGVLISLVWAVEVVVEPHGESERKEFVMAPEGTEIVV